MAKDIKIYKIDDKCYQFDSNAFNNFFSISCKKSGINKLEFETDLGEELSVSHSAVHSWRFGENGPSDIETVMNIASVLEISDHMLLLKERKEKSFMQITERQKDSLKRIYDAVIDYLDHFQRSYGFNNYWHMLCDQGMEPIYVESELYKIAEEAQHKVELVLMKEYIELHNLPIYEQLEEYVYDDLVEIYNGKLSYAYRFEAGVENADGTRDTVTLDEDYTQAIKKFDDIMEAYMG